MKSGEKPRDRLQRYRELRKSTSDEAARRALDELIREVEAQLIAEPNAKVALHKT